MELVFLGTGAGLPTKERNVSSCVLNLMVECNALWLFDCGEGTQHQFLQTRLKINKIDKIFITHLHGDHLFGLPGLLGSRSFRNEAGELTIYGPKGIKQFLEVVLKISESYIPYPLNIVEIEEGIVFEDEQFIVTTALLDHRIASYGFRVVEKDKLGRLDVDLLKIMDIPSGSHLKLLKEGQIVTLEDGRVIDGKDLLKSPEKAKVVAIFGDTKPTPSAIALANNADIMVHEATVEGSLAESAAKYGHSSTLQTATIAKQAKVKKLIITHISARYGLSDYERLVAECRTIFANTEMAEDFSVFKV
ncbi:ribonuclease Z [Entomomonas asaccharolytica]|uniref:Ribonuclease Z n=1 Tax=Entomomonas asaccharolytica TaxID=2785331 RepID=A0A974RY80_9GAMM|nr:ribonuclease Z [Entomomonas asaccharolytica]QQP87036.1 ribonuclease Z [Entomomonas asaccharolytica]